jgi:GntR family transcriptional regulator, carbon starvation induced regulator
MTVSTAEVPDSDERKETLASHVYDRLRQEIIRVAIAPGEKLHIRSLCDRFEVGLSPMREALSRLSSEGLVVQYDHRGFAVAPVSEADLVDLTRARCWVNELAIRNSIANGDAAWEEAVVLSFHRLSRTPTHTPGVENERSPAWEVAHRIFHTSLIAASGSRRLEQYCEYLFDSSERYRHIGRQAGMKGGNRDGEHRALMEAAVARDAAAAAKLIKAHFEHTAELVQGVLTAQGF